MRREGQGTRATDFIHLALQCELPELLEWQGQQEVDATTDGQQRVIERPLPFRLGADGLGGVRHSPVGDDRLPGEHRARLPGPIADGDHEVPRLAHHAVQALGGMPRVGVLVGFERCDGQGIHLGRRLRTSTLRHKPSAPFPIQDGLGDLTPRAVSGADKEQAQWAIGGQGRHRAVLGWGGTRVERAVLRK